MNSRDRLNEILNTPKSRLARRLRGYLHSSSLYRYGTGERTPSLKVATLIEALSDGEVRANGWIDVSDEL